VELNRRFLLAPLVRWSVVSWVFVIQSIAVLGRSAEGDCTDSILARSIACISS
jgi:hypothetical protein